MEWEGRRAEIELTVDDLRLMMVCGCVLHHCVVWASGEHDITGVFCMLPLAKQKEWSDLMEWADRSGARCWGLWWCMEVCHVACYGSLMWCCWHILGDWECWCCPNSVDSVHKAPAQLWAAMLESPQRIIWGIIWHMEKQYYSYLASLGNCPSYTLTLAY